MLQQYDMRLGGGRKPPSEIGEAAHARTLLTMMTFWPFLIKMAIFDQITILKQLLTQL